MTTKTNKNYENNNKINGLIVFFSNSIFIYLAYVLLALNYMIKVQIKVATLEIYAFEELLKHTNRKSFFVVMTLKTLSLLFV